MKKIRLNEYRLEYWLKGKGWSKKRFAKELGINESYFCNILKGRKEPSKQIMKKVMLATGYHFGDCIFYLERDDITDKLRNGGGNYEK